MQSIFAFKPLSSLANPIISSGFIFISKKFSVYLRGTNELIVRAYKHLL